MSDTEEKEEKPAGRISEGFFSYKSVEEAEQAVTEREKIRRLEKQLDYKKPKLVLALYTKAVEGEVFKTAEGFAYLCKLRSYLEERKDELGTTLAPIPVNLTGTQEEHEADILRLRQSLKEEHLIKLRMRQKLMSLRIVIAFLVLALIAMLVIAGASDSPNILNYDRVLQDRYAGWEQELKEREETLRARELEIKRE